MDNTDAKEPFIFMASEKMYLSYMALFILKLLVWPQNENFFLLWAFVCFLHLTMLSQG
jgi:hypothetical protein